MVRKPSEVTNELVGLCERVYGGFVMISPNLKATNGDNKLHGTK